MKRAPLVICACCALAVPCLAQKKNPVTTVIKEIMHEHPSQALLDAFTILRHKKTFKGLHVSIVGDIFHSRVARSACHLLSKFGLKITLCGPPEFVPDIATTLAPGLHLTRHIEDAVRGADVLMKAGEFKDTGSPTRDMTPAERGYLQGMIDNMHTQFIQAVADGRNMKFDQVKAIANGKVWTGQQALPMKLVDQVADFQAAVEDTAKSVNIKGEPVLVRPEKDRKTLGDLIFGDLSDWLPSREKLMDQHVGFYYMWK